MLGVQHLGVPLHAGHPPLGGLERRHRGGVGGREHVEARRRCGHRVAVRHPHRVRGRDVGQQCAGARHPHRRTAVLAGARSRTPRRRAPAPSAGTRSTCRRPGRPASNRARSMPGAFSAYTLEGPPERMIAFGCLASISSTGMCAARSRSRPAPPAPGGRSAGRTAPRSRPPGPSRVPARWTPWNRVPSWPQPIESAGWSRTRVVPDEFAPTRGSEGRFPLVRRGSHDLPAQPDLALFGGESPALSHC